MPIYDINGHKVRRKNFYMPCVLGPRAEAMTEDEYAAILKATYWADNITNAEWPALLQEEGFSPSARSRLKKKAAGWLIALGRVAVLNPDLFAEIMEKATATYEEQTETEYPGVEVAAAAVGLQTFRKWHESDEGTMLRVHLFLDGSDGEDD